MDKLDNALNDRSSSSARDAVPEFLSDRFARLCERRSAKVRTRTLLNTRVGIVSGFLGCVALLAAEGHASEWLAGTLLIALASCICLAVALARQQRALQRRLTVCKLTSARRRVSWSELPEPKIPALLHAHPYAADLSIAGPRSLHHLLDSAGTSDGSWTLYSWLSAPAENGAMLAERRELVKWFERNPGMRLRLGWSGISLRDTIALDPNTAHGSNECTDSAVRLYFGVWVLIIVAALGGFTGAAILFLFCYTVYQAFKIDFSALWSAPVSERKIATILSINSFCIQWRHRTDGVVARRFRALSDPESGMQAFQRRLERLAWFEGLQHRPVLLTFLNILFPLTPIVSRFRQRMFDDAAQASVYWANTWGAIEAACSLSSLADRHGFCAAVVSDADVLQLDEFGHPLMCSEVENLNTVCLHGDSPIVCLTGANMSGKSTLLRSIGLNLVLFLAGARVKARSGRLPVLRLVTSISAQDDFESGYSRFAAEVRQVRMFSDLLCNDDIPKVFLFDELFSSTNNEERLEAIESFLKRILETTRVYGFLSTHDSGVIDLLAPFLLIQIKHMSSTIENGVLKFEYTMEHGKATSRNALHILRSHGIIPSVEL